VSESKREGEILKEFAISFSKLGGRLFRCNSGMAWAGNAAVIKQTRNCRVHPGDVIIKQARPFHGMVKGTSDMLGFTKMYITPEMVGREIAVFTAIEVKTPGVYATKEQKSFIKMVTELGGISLIAKKFDDVLQAIEIFKRGK